MILLLETPIIATSGGLTIGEKAVPPIPPKLEMVNVPPFISFGFNALFSWSFHQKSWSECIRFPILTIRYEDLETKTFETFKIVYDFIKKISKSEKKFDNKRAKKIIQECEFDKLQRLEKISGFRESMIGKNNNEKLRFFNLGSDNNYKKLLDGNLVHEMNNLYRVELQKYNYE